MTSEIFQDEILVPKARVAVLIGKKGRVKKHIEKKGRVKIEIDKFGQVIIKSKDAISIMISRKVIEAIGRGFNPEIAEKIFKDDFGYELVSFQNHITKKSDVPRLRGLIIGAGGKSRQTIERLTGTRLSVYGKTVAIIGLVSDVSKARHAVEMLLTGARHTTVYRFLEHGGQ